MSVHHYIACTSNMNLPLPWIARSYRTRPRIKKRMSSLVNFFFQPCPSSPYVIRCHHFFSTLRGKNVFFFITDHLWTGDTAKEFVFFRLTAISIGRHKSYDYMNTEPFFTLLGPIPFFKKKVLLNRWKHGFQEKKNGKIFANTPRASYVSDM